VTAARAHRRSAIASAQQAAAGELHLQALVEAGGYVATTPDLGRPGAHAECIDRELPALARSATATATAHRSLAYVRQLLDRQA
jgi:hypothetical protein